jgi:hypothetical protein
MFMFGPFGSQRRHRLAASFVAVALLPLAISCEAIADDPVEIALSLHPARIDPFAAPSRLLPADPDLKPGNAAVVLNGLMAERLGYWSLWDTIVDDARLPVGDPRIAATEVAGIIPDMTRAGLIRDADWNHPVRAVGANVSLGDMQMVRGLLDRPLTIWIKQKLAERDLTAAIEGIRTQLACARHMGNAPFMITAMQAHAVGTVALDNLEYLVAESGCPNLRWSLSVLPPLLFDAPSMLEWHTRLLELSLPRLKMGIPHDSDDEAWQQIASDYFDLIQDSQNPLASEQRADLILRCAPLGRERLVRRGLLSADAAMAISPEASVMRAILDHHADIGRQMRLAWALPRSEAIGQLAKVDALAGAWDLDIDSWPLANGFVKDFLFFNHFSRRTVMLETVESLRHHAATHDGELPAALADLEYAPRRDPVSGLPFIYVRGESPSAATLSMPDIPGVPDDAQQRRTYKIEMVSP